MVHHSRLATYLLISSLLLACSGGDPEVTDGTGGTASSAGGSAGSGAGSSDGGTAAGGDGGNASGGDGGTAAGGDGGNESGGDGGAPLGGMAGAGGADGGSGGSGGDGGTGAGGNLAGGAAGAAGMPAGSAGMAGAAGAPPWVPPASCGNGVLEPVEGEFCDDGNDDDDDGCAACLVTDGFFCAGSPSRCITWCGDGVVAGDEQCDDGGTEAGDGCDLLCQAELGWTCDPSGNTCSEDCGDGMIVGDEGCDDADSSDPGCSAECQPEPGYSCESQPSECAIRCGDGVVGGDEECDDGPRGSNDGCSYFCEIETGYSCSGEPSVCQDFCGNGVINPTSESCDDRNDDPTDGCDACTITTGYSCDDEPSVCAEFCGNGVVNPTTEDCDDGNDVDDDACSNECAVQEGYFFEAEDNDVAVRANALPAGDVRALGDFGDNDDSDWFRITLGMPSDLRLAYSSDRTEGCRTTIDDGSPNLDLSVYVFASDGTTELARGINHCDDLTWRNNEELRAMPAGDYYVRVRSRSTLVSSYTLDVHIDGSCGDGVVTGREECDSSDRAVCTAACDRVPDCSDAFLDGDEECVDTGVGDGCDASCQLEALAEVEGNDSTADADARWGEGLVIDGTTAIRGSITDGSDEDDYFRLDLASEQWLHVRLATDPGRRCEGLQDGAMFLRNASGDAIERDRFSEEADGLCPAFARRLPAGTYYLQVFEWGVNDSLPAYLLEVTMSDAPYVEQEATPGDNDTAATAEALPVGTVLMVDGDYAGSGDVDYFAVTVPPGKGVTALVGMGEAPSTGLACYLNDHDTTLAVLGPTGEVLAYNVDDGPGYCSRSGNSVLSGDLATVNATDVPVTYYVRHGTFSSGAPARRYHLVVSVE